MGKYEENLELLRKAVRCEPVTVYRWFHVETRILHGHSMYY